ncbi:hypothetical protein CC1G_09405 [Coprinopsis cinerea okayama7|uniref:Uncharacterized protein n=1 Tax=Coprinopsis cinerea (strain Okayama-7 / 130 / ATCC MYA-4618 / FGSC 9003) TaxID=240176 RepID=A8NIG5_COPC7|nr:hypothetical protein CC1G_09405 [Coprinopsis cinerea okayama7\|eukprot:XP_001833991.2 hypothetical protein CC1G_09405 [Coprinopsis cinerea okayama7\
MGPWFSYGNEVCNAPWYWGDFPQFYSRGLRRRNSGEVPLKSRLWRTTHTLTTAR